MVLRSYPRASTASLAVGMSCASLCYVLRRRQTRSKTRANTNSAGQSYRMRDLSLSQMSQSQHTCSIPRCKVRFPFARLPAHAHYVIHLVRYIPHDVPAYPLSQTQPPFRLDGAHNVFLETIKRGEHDDFDAKGDAANANVNVVLRLYEAYGGHARVKLHVGGHIPVARAFVTNLLEDETLELHVAREDDASGSRTTLTLDFHAFEVKTVKLVIGPKASEEM